MKKVILAIGIPGSGKTAILSDFAKNHGYTYISTDVIREKLTGDPINQSKNKEAWEIGYAETKAALQRGESVAYDATFYKPEERKDFIQFVRKQGAERVEGIYFTVPLEVAKERNKERAKEVPEHALKRMHDSLHTSSPSREDGFDFLMTLNTDREIEKTKVELEATMTHKELQGRH